MSHSETSDIENRDQLPPISIPLNAQVLEPLVRNTIFVNRTLFAGFDLSRLRDLSGTSRVDSQSGLRGPDGNPVIANFMPAMSTGHTVESSTVVQTGNLSDPGVSSPDYVSREYLDSALKAVENRWSEKYDRVEKELGDIKRMLKRKQVAEPEPTRREPVVPTPLPNTTNPVDLSIDELKSLLLTKLLSQAPDNQQDADIFSLLHSHHHHQQQHPPISVQPTNIGRTTESNFSNADVLKAFTLLNQAFQLSCQTHAAVQFRRHDHDHEGETRREQSASGRQLVVVENVVPISTVSGRERSSNQGEGTSTSQRAEHVERFNQDMLQNISDCESKITRTSRERK
ncbi:hypothetical protein L6452_06959 [Arctium lappa]|uniref:Uncharacterized protein n=1 Tax=Arctium lappa TaxID=4217 RepID=A0ACB9EK06_ARCLA|nr:hypothetical protein L6452_06959 [Arctium lappa]